MQISDIIGSDAEENINQLILTPFNSTNPFLWGKDLKYVFDGELIEPTGICIKFPIEFDFFNAWCGKDPESAKQYYEGMHLL